MAITKTNFINYSRCPRYVSLDNLKKNKLDSLVSLEEYKKEEESEKIKEILGNMYDEEDNDLIDVRNEHLEVMLPYYNKVELLAGKIAPKYFKGTFKYSKSTYTQESFDAKINGIRYLCYVDIYNETEDAFNIIEVKATTTKKFLAIGKKIKEEGYEHINSIFIKEGNIYKLIEDTSFDIKKYMEEDKYYKYKQKLFNRYDPAGHYVYDLAIQRYIIENDLKQNKMEDKIDKIKYYLAVLNSKYVFDGTYENDEPVYNTDSNGEDIVSFIDLTNVTKDYMDKIDLDRKRVELYITNLKADRVKLGEYCELKKTTKCKYSPLCYDILPSKNSIMCYIDSHHGFKDSNGTLYERFDLINNGIVSMLDVPKEYLNREKNVIQRNVVETGIPYMNKEKIKEGIKKITYPIYHLDFETFPCPLPRYKGEVCYTQSVFQFSLHIEKEEGICDNDKDHYGFLSPDHLDRREELIKSMCDLIDTSKGTILVYNEAFEKTRLKELGQIFPHYKEKLNKMREMIFDLMFLTKTSTKFYKKLGFDDKQAALFNYYHQDMQGSFSIKKILPLFSNLTYKGMEIANGVEALVAYASFPKLKDFEFEHKYQKLVEYCKQDTWSMVEILWGLKESVK